MKSTKLPLGRLTICEARSIELNQCFYLDPDPPPYDREPDPPLSKAGLLVDLLPLPPPLLYEGGLAVPLPRAYDGLAP